MRSALSSTLAVLAISALHAPGTASALEIYANGGIGNSGSLIGTSDPFSTGIGQGFTVGAANTNNLLTSITLALATDPAQTNLNKLVFALYSSTGSTPGTSLPSAEIGRFASAPSGGWGTGSAAEYTFAFASGTQTLSLNTSYWIVATYENETYTPAAATPFVNWRDSSPGVLPSAKNSAAIAYLGIASRAPGFGAWSSSPLDQFLSIRVNATVVPEPSTYALGIVSVLTLGAVARRRTRNRSRPLSPRHAPPRSC